MLRPKARIPPDRARPKAVPGQTSRFVSRFSKWTDPEWIFDDHDDSYPTYRAVKWDFEMPDGSLFTGDKWHELREAMRVYMWGLHHNPLEGLARKGKTLHRTSFYLRSVVRWMAQEGMKDLSEFNNAASWAFLDEQVRLWHEEDAIPSATFLCGLVSAIAGLWQQRPLLLEAGLRAIPEEPFDGLSGSEVARRRGSGESTPVPPIPDEVALPILQAAHRLLGAPADDVINFTRAYFDIYYGRKELANCTRLYHVKKQLLGWRFSTIPGEKAPWRRLADFKDELVYEASRGAIQVRLNLGRQIGKIIEDIRDACAVVIQAETGIRISEVITPEIAPNDESGLPRCVSTRISQSGLNELFFLSGEIVKGRRKPEPVQWLIGMRPKGTNYLPPPVRAIAILEKLYHPWRCQEDAPAEIRNALFLSFAHAGYRPSNIQGRAVRPAWTHCIRNGQREFIARHVDLSSLPDLNQRGEALSRYRDTKGVICEPRQWRVNYAQYIWRIDSRMVPAIAQQFKHMSLAMTEESYIGNDVGLLSELDSMRTQKTVAIMKTWASGAPQATGHFSKVLEKHRNEIVDRIRGLSGRAIDDALTDFVLENDLRIWFADHGDCFFAIDPSAAQCHKRAGTSSWTNTSPNAAYREPSVCSGCRLYYVDSDHRDFWMRRLATNESVVSAANQAGEVAPMIAVARVTQAKSVLAKIEVQKGERRG